VGSSSNGTGVTTLCPVSEGTLRKPDPYLLSASPGSTGGYCDVGLYGLLANLTFFSRLARNSQKLCLVREAASSMRSPDSPIRLQATLAILEIMAISLLFPQPAPANTNQPSLEQAGNITTSVNKEDLVETKNEEKAINPRHNETAIPRPTITPTPKIFEKQPLAALPIPENNYIPQDTENACGAAVMAMVLAEQNQKDVMSLYQEIMKYYDLYNKPDLYLGPIALVDYLKDHNPKTTKIFRQSPWEIDQLDNQIKQHGSTIVDVTSKYGKVTETNNPNHWIIVDGILYLNNNTPYVVIRDPLRPGTTSNEKQDLLPFMLPYENGSILIPADILLSAIGKNSIYFENNNS
jgi:hypothetical protein